jgi:hypothetical protein
MSAVLDFGKKPGVQNQEPFAALHMQFFNPLKRFFRGYRLNAADVEDSSKI